jgi:hypothetical protein
MDRAAGHSCDHNARLGGQRGPPQLAAADSDEATAVSVSLDSGPRRSSLL